QEWRPLADHSAQHPRSQLGPDGDDHTRVVLEGLARADDAVLTSLARATRRRTRTSPAHGLPHLRARLHDGPCTDREHGPTTRVPTAGLAAVRTHPRPRT